MRNLLLLFALLLLPWVLIPCTHGIAEEQESTTELFDSSEKALVAVKLALLKQDTDKLSEIFGESADEIFFTGDLLRDRAALTSLSRRFHEKVDLMRIMDPDLKKEEWYNVRYGREGWHFEIPLVKKKEGWSFFPEYKQKINQRLLRHMNELTTIDTLKALIQAQARYQKKDRDGDGYREYAKRFISLPGRIDGLYWSAEDYMHELSPLDVLVARSMKKGFKASKDNVPTYAGYVYRIIPDREIKVNPDRDPRFNKIRYTQGVAFLAYPAKWGKTGDYTFMVNMEGKVFKKDLGFRTRTIARKVEYMEVNRSWREIDPILYKPLGDT